MRQGCNMARRTHLRSNRRKHADDSEQLKAEYKEGNTLLTKAISKREKKQMWTELIKLVEDDP